MKQEIFDWTYQALLKPVLFQYDAEKVHERMTNLGSMLGSFPPGRWLLTQLLCYRHPVLSKKIAGITFPNPVGLSAGFDYEAKLPNVLGAVGFGFATIGTVTLHPYGGNAKPRMARFPRSQALLVNKGFKSPGAIAVIEKLTGKKFDIPIGISIGSTNQEYQSIAEQVADIEMCFDLFERSKVQHAYYELNISCPNTKSGQPFTDKKNLQLLFKTLSKMKIQRPVFLKMPIDLGAAKTLVLLKEADKSFIHGVIFGNLTKDKENPDVDEQDRIRWQRSVGNLSGKPTWHRSNDLISLTKLHFGKRFVIIGTGGIFSPADAAHKMELGADLVQLITGMVYQGPQLIGQINAHLAQIAIGRVAKLQ